MIISCAEPGKWVEQQDVRGGSNQPRSAKGPASKSKDDGARRPREESLHILFNVDKLVKFLTVKNASEIHLLTWKPKTEGRTTPRRQEPYFYDLMT